ncbi:GP46-like surface antigen, putative, partial [Bodo saltans]
MSKMTTLVLNANSLVGSLPAEWSNLRAMVGLQLQSNQLSGTLPNEWSSMSNLRMLCVQFNSLIGTLPSSWANMTQISSLLLYSNGLTGALPSSWSSMKELVTSWAFSNSVTGSLPASWSSMSKLTVLYLQGNSLNGTLPSSWSNMSSMMDLELNQNSLVGTLPPSWGNMSKMTTLVLKANSLTGSLPESWGLMSTLQRLATDNNCLHGPVPDAYRAILRVPSGLSTCATRIRSGGGNVTVCSGTPAPRYCDRLTSHSGSSSLSRTISTSITDSASLTQGTTTISTASQLSSSISLGSTRRTWTHSVSATSSTWNCTMIPADLTVSLAPLLSTTAEMLSFESAVMILSALPTWWRGNGLQQATSTVSARPLSRIVMKTSPTLVINLTFTSAALVVDRWVVSNVTLSGQVIPYWTVTSWNTVPWSAIILPAPPGGWIDANTPVLTDATIFLAVTMTCDGSPVLSIGVVVPAPGASLELVSQVTAAGGYSQIASVLAGGASSGSSLGRVMAMRSMVLCDADSAVGGGVIDLGVVLCAAAGAPTGSGSVAARSAIVSNVVLVCVVACVLLAASAAWSRCANVSVRRALCVFCV